MVLCDNCAVQMYSGTSLYGHTDITDNFICPKEKLIFRL